MYVAVQNPTGAPVVIDRDGATVAAGAWGVAVTSNPEVQAAAAAGDLHLYPYGADGSADAVNAVTLATRLNAANSTVLNDAWETTSRKAV